MAKQRTQEFWVVDGVDKTTKLYTYHKERGYVRTFGNMISGNNIEVGIYRRGAKWAIIEYLTGLYMARYDLDKLQDCIKYCQRDDLIDKVATFRDRADHPTYINQ